MDDLAIIGSGPAALTAGLYAGREKLAVSIYEKASMGGQLSAISAIENFPGAPDGSTGMELANRLREQAKSFGAQLRYGEVSSVKRTKDAFELVVDGQKKRAKAVLVATGCTHVHLGVPGEKLAGVHYCATCDGAFYKGKNIAVVGGANSAVQEALFLTRFANHVTIVALFDIMACDVLQKRLAEAVKAGKVKVLTHTETLEITGEERVSGLRVKDSKTGKESSVKADGVFVFIGLKPSAEFLANSGVELSEKGFVKTDADFMTNVPGIFAAGDIRDGSVKQAVVAAGEGAAAAVGIQRYIQSL